VTPTVLDLKWPLDAPAIAQYKQAMVGFEPAPPEAKAAHAGPHQLLRDLGLRLPQLGDDARVLEARGA